MIEEKKITITPTELDMLSLQHEFKIEDEKNKNEWKSCCLVIDKRAVMYFTQIGIISGAMIFAIYQLINVEDCPSQQAYLGLLTMLIGILVPQPKFHESESS